MNPTQEEQLILDYIRRSGFVTAIKLAVATFNREFDRTDWPEGQPFPLGGEIRLEDEGHQPAHVICNLGKTSFRSLYESAGFTVTIKFGERQHRGKETMRRVTIKATICRDALELYVYVRLFNVDGRTHEPGQDFTFDSRYQVNLQDWIVNHTTASENCVALVDK